MDMSASISCACMMHTLVQVGKRVGIRREFVVVRAKDILVEVLRICTPMRNVATHSGSKLAESFEVDYIQSTSDGESKLANLRSESRRT